MHFLEPYYVSEIVSPYAQVYDVKHNYTGICISQDVCAACGAVLRKGYFQAEQLILKKGLLPDMLYRYRTDFYVSRRFRAAWEKEGLSGIDAFIKADAVKMLGRKDMVEDEYYLAVPSVPDVRLDVIRSKCVSGTAVIKDMSAYLEDIGKRSVVCESCGKLRLRMRSGKLWEPAWQYPETWVLRGKREHDLTAISNMPGVYILSDRFIELVKRHGLTNVYALTEAELRFAQDNADKKDTFVFVPVYTDSAAKEAPQKRYSRYWREADRGSITCKNGSFMIRDVLDDDEAYALQIRVKAGVWHIERTEEEILLWHEGAVSVADVQAGTVSVDAGAIYLRDCERDRRAEKRIREALMEMGDSVELKNIRRLALSIRRSVPAAFFMTETGDGEYKVYVDSTEEATAVRIRLHEY